MNDFKRGHLWANILQPWPLSGHVYENPVKSWPLSGHQGGLLISAKSSVLPSDSPAVISRPLCSLKS